MIIGCREFTKRRSSSCLLIAAGAPRAAAKDLRFRPLRLALTFWAPSGAALALDSHPSARLTKISASFNVRSLSDTQKER